VIELFFPAKKKKEFACHSRKLILSKQNKETFMIDRSSIYFNPVIDQGYYYMKVIDIQTEPYPDCVMPLIQVRLQPHPEEGFAKDCTFSAIVYPTSQARYHMMNFLSTFLKNEETDVEKVLHRWGCVQIYTAQYGKSKYSAIHWIYQTSITQRNIERIYEEEREQMRCRRDAI
jgi:hypothetical protein